MALQIANPVVVSKVERLAKSTGLSKTAVVDRALDLMLTQTASDTRSVGRLSALLAQLDRIPDRPDASDPLAWDERGLPK
ncbi:MAG: transcriptional regulator [Methylibium sp. NZG]|nr:MAG: transcriptional regulator [Methylibium sp. NZG]